MAYDLKQLMAASSSFLPFKPKVLVDFAFVNLADAYSRLLTTHTVSISYSGVPTHPNALPHEEGSLHFNWPTKVSALQAPEITSSNFL